MRLFWYTKCDNICTRKDEKGGVNFMSMLSNNPKGKKKIGFFGTIFILVFGVFIEFMKRSFKDKK